MDIDEYYNASYEVKDNFLSEVEFAKLEGAIMGPEFNWNYSYNVSDGGDSENDIYFMHLFYIGTIVTMFLMVVILRMTYILCIYFI